MVAARFLGTAQIPFTFQNNWSSYYYYELQHLSFSLNTGVNLGTDNWLFNNRVFPKLDHSGKDVRIVLEQNEFSKKVTSNRD